MICKIVETAYECSFVVMFRSSLMDESRDDRKQVTEVENFT